MSDISDRIHAALEADPAIDHRHCELRVETDADGVVHLHGTVPDIASRRLVPRRARDAAGTAAIADHLRLQVAEARPDDQLADRVDRALRSDTVFAGATIARDGREPQPGSGQRILITVTDGVVRLDGELASLSHRRLAEALAWAIPGVRDVDDRIHVVPPEQDDDGEISEALALVFERDRALDADAVRPRVENAVVHLEGTVATREQADRAVRNCWAIAGVHDVRDALAVAP